MADSSFTSQQGSYDEAVLTQTQLANCVMHLFQQPGFSPTPLTPLSDFLAHECDFDGYSAATIAAWSDPVLAGQAWAIYAPIQTFRWVFDTGVVNTVGGYFIVTAAGHLKDFVVFNPGEPVASTGQAVIRTPAELFPWG